jgi:hypothetical protein
MGYRAGEAQGPGREDLNGLILGAMWALFVATVYFGTFLVIGWVAKRVLDRWMDQRGVELSEVQKQAGRRGERTVFLLGVWRKESDG